jgi:hypothetical protein
MLGYLNLVLGTGLLGSEPFQLTCDDIARTDLAVVVRAQGRRRGSGGRWIPVRAQYEDAVAALALLPRPMRKYKNLESIKAVQQKFLVEISPYRLRAYWLQGLLGEPVSPAALTAAGVGSIDTVVNQLSPTVDAATYQRMLRGTSCCVSCHEGGVGAAAFDPTRFTHLRQIEITGEQGQ